MSDLKSIFLDFCDSVKKGSTTATDKTISKICSDCHIYDKKLNSNSVDIAFRKHVGNAKKFVDYAEFESFIDGALATEYARAHNISETEAAEQIRSKIMKAAPKAHGATKISGDAATSRLTDVKGYTGAHKERFDAETGKGKGIEGREYLMDDKAASGYVGGYKGKDTYDKHH